MKQKRQIVILCVLGTLAAAVFYFDVKDQIQRPVGATSKPYPALGIENPSLRWDKLKASEETEYRSNGRDLFSEVVVKPRAVVQVKEPEFVKKGPEQPPPPAPPKLPVKFYGSGTVPGAPKRAFLTDGDQIYIVGEGDTLLGRYRILRITNATLEFEEISSGMRAIAPLEADAAPQ